MTMDISENEVEYLNSTLQTHVVTYRTAARDLNMHVSKSKQMLYDYYNLNKSTVTASFIVTGTRLGTTIVQMFQNEDDFALQRDQFDDIRTVHVYCLTLVKNHPLTSEIAMEDLRHPVDLGDLDRYYALGLTKGTDLAHVEQVDKKSLEKKSQLKEKNKVPQKTTAIASTTGPVESKPKPKLEYTSRKEKAKTPSLISNYVSRKGESKASVPAKREAALLEESSKSASKPAYQYKSRKMEQSQPKERVVISSMVDDDMDVDSVSESVPQPTNPPVSTNLSNLFLDDLSDFSDDTKDDAEEEPIVVENTEEEAPQPSEAAQAAQVPEDSIFRKMVNSASQTPRSPTPPPVTTVDEDGYITTYRSKEKEPKEPKEKKAPVRAPIARSNTEKKGDGKKKQASLMSFFGKR